MSYARPAQPELPAPPGWPDPPAPAAWQGLAGQIVETIAPHTEADPVAILAQLLVAAGATVGRGPGWQSRPAGIIPTSSP